ncbi:hypothetical protein ACFL96_01270 [Thermoproteota archaeon]
MNSFNTMKILKKISSISASDSEGLEPDDWVPFLIHELGKTFDRNSNLLGGVGRQLTATAIALLLL